MQIVILGGGIVGLTAAALLAQNSNLRITVIERQEPALSYDKNNYDIRCSAITAAAQQIFRTLGIWDQIRNERVGVYSSMQVWGANPNQALVFNAAAIGQPALGHIIENRVMLNALWHKVQSCHNMQIKYATAQDISQTNTEILLHLERENLQCDLLIGADGAESWLRKKANIDCYTHAYSQMALVATIKSEHPHQATARQCFTNEGPLAFLPLDHPYMCSIVWSIPKAKVLDLLQLEPAEFCAQLQNKFAVLGKLELIGERANFPLRVQHASSYIANRIALIGDAAHVVHPLAGQGLNLGLLDAAAIADVVLNALNAKRDIGSLSALRKYERWRKAHNLSMLAVTDGFTRMYEANFNSIQTIRDVGLSIVNKMQVSKNVLIRLAMGLVGDLPASARVPLVTGLL